ncbi:PAS domain-containing protein [Streptomyces sp. ID05-26A]|nr:PAS domain-containing protein [Streptomyces sp. ID05-26A]
MDDTGRHARELQERLDLLPVAVWAVDTSLAFTDVAGRMFDGHPRPLVGSPLADYLGVDPGLRFDGTGAGRSPGPQRPGCEVSWEAHLRALSGESVQWRVDMPSGACLYSVWPIADVSGAVRGAAGTLIPLTAAYAATMAETEARTWTSEVLEHSPAAVVVRDHTDRLVWASAAYCRMMRRPLVDLVGAAPGSLHDADDPNLHRERNEIVRRTGQTFPERNAFVVNGRRFEVEGARFRLLSPSGQQLVGELFFDITDRESARRRADHAEERFEQFMAHTTAYAAVFDDKHVIRWTNERTASLAAEIRAATGEPGSALLKDHLFSNSGSVSVDEAVAEVLRTGRPVPARWEIRLGERNLVLVGDLFPLGAEPNPASPGSPAGIRAVGALLMDVSDQERLAGRLSTVLTQLPVLVNVIERDGTIGSISGDFLSAPPRRRWPHDEEHWTAALAGDRVLSRVIIGDRWHEVSYTPLREGDQITSVLALAWDVDDQVEAERQITASHARFDAFMRLAPVGAWIKDKAHRYVWANELHLRHLGGPELRDVMGRTAAELGAPWHTDDSDDEDDAALRLCRPLEVRGEYVVDGTRRVQKGQVFPLSTDGTQGEELLAGVFTDVTELEHARAAAAAAHARFEAFMRHVPAAAYIKDAEGGHVWANPTYLGFYRTELTALVGKTTNDLDPPELAAGNVAEDEATLLGGTARRIRNDGSHGEACATGFRFPLPLPDGETGLAGIWIDTTELHQVRIELGRWRDRYRTLFDRSPTPMAITSLDGVLLDANPAFCELLGLRASQLRNRHVREFSEVGDHDAEQAALEGIMGRRTTTARFRKTFVRAADQSRTPVDITAIRVTDPTDQADTIVGIVQPLAAPAAARTALLLSGTEAAVLALRAEGRALNDIATHLKMTRRGVDYHLRQLARKLRCPANNAAAITARAYHLGVLDTETWPPTVAARHVRTPDTD